MRKGEGADGVPGFARGLARGFARSLESRVERAGDSDNRAIAGGAGMAVVPGEKMFEEGVDFLVLIASELDVFLEREVAGAAGEARCMEGGDGLELDAVEFFAELRVWHGRRNITTVERGCNGTLVLRKRSRKARSGAKNFPGCPDRAQTANRPTRAGADLTRSGVAFTSGASLPTMAC